MMGPIPGPTPATVLAAPVRAVISQADQRQAEGEQADDDESVKNGKVRIERTIFLVQAMAVVVLLEHPARGWINW